MAIGKRGGQAGGQEAGEEGRREAGRGIGKGAFVCIAYFNASDCPSAPLTHLLRVHERPAAIGLIDVLGGVVVLGQLRGEEADQVCEERCLAAPRRMTALAKE